MDCKNERVLQHDIKTFYDFCRENGIPEEEITEMAKPLSAMISKAKIKQLIKSTLIWLLILGTIYAVYENETVQWHGSAIGRIFLIKLLPYWDWRPLQSQKCLIGRPQPDIVAETNTISCSSCENIYTAEKVSATNFKDVLFKYLIIGAPAIISDAYDNWYTHEHELNFTTFLHENNRLGESIPCRIQTNILIGRQPRELFYIFGIFTTNEIPSWFLHFQNCDLNAVKQLRILAPRPYFIPPHIPPSHFNWLLISKNYDSPRYKYLEIDNGLVMIYQIKGKSKLLLSPRTACIDVCNEIKIILEENEVLIFGNKLWELYYKPMRGFNVAIVTETDWSEN